MMFPAPQGSSVTATSLILPADLSLERWQKVGRDLGQTEKALQWWIGDWWAYGEHHYGSRTAIVNSEDWDGPTFKACADAATVCRKFETTSRRREVLSFTHHREVAALSLAKADRLLDWCEETIAETGRPRSRAQLRKRVSETAASSGRGGGSSRSSGSSGSSSTGAAASARERTSIFREEFARIRTLEEGIEDEWDSLTNEDIDEAAEDAKTLSERWMNMHNRLRRRHLRLVS